MEKLGIIELKGILPQGAMRIIGKPFTKWKKWTGKKYLQGTMKQGKPMMWEHGSLSEFTDTNGMSITKAIPVRIKKQNVIGYNRATRKNEEYETNEIELNMNKKSYAVIFNSIGEYLEKTGGTSFDLIGYTFKYKIELQKKKIDNKDVEWLEIKNITPVGFKK